MNNLPSGPWAILRSALDQYLEADIPGGQPDPDEVEALYAARDIGARTGGGIAVMAIHGPIVQRDSIFSLMFGGTSTTRLTQQMGRLAEDDSVSTILLNVDSPGGTIGGLPEAAAAIRKARETKRVVAFVNPLAASAAYWLASQADEIVSAPEGLIGSVGVLMEHQDWSGALENEGVGVTYVAKPPEKVDVNWTQPLSESGRDELERLVSAGYDLFVADIAKGRGITPAKVRKDYTARILSADDAKAAGMVDRIATFGETVDRLARRRAIAVDTEVTTSSGADVPIEADGFVTDEADLTSPPALTDSEAGTDLLRFGGALAD